MIDATTLLTPLDQDVVFNEWMSALEDAGVPSDSWRVGGPMRTLMRIIAATIVAAWTVIIGAISGGFLETAAGNWLTLLAFYVYGVTRISATFASGNLTVTNSGGGLYGPFAPGEFIALNPTTKAAYANTTTITINPGQTLTVPVQALVAGSSSTSSAATVTALQTPLSQVTVTNPADLVGLDEQTDTDLKTLCMLKLGALSLLGPRDAYAYAIRTANDNGNPVDVNRSSITRTSSTGTVAVVCASPGGTPTPGDLTAVADNIEAVARPDTVTVSVAAATVVASSQIVTVYAVTTAGLDAPTLQSLVQDAITALQSTYPIGGLSKPPSTQGYLFASDLTGAAKAAHAAIFAVDGFTDIALGSGQVAEITLSVTVRFVTSQAA